MAEKDWKELLNDLVPKSEETSNIESQKKENETKITNTPQHRQDFIIRFEKRNGKPATIVSNFQGTEQELKDLARKLKTFCGAGGSAKDDEILIQGDVRQRITAYLRQIGHKVRGNI